MSLSSCLMEEHGNRSQKWKMMALAGELNNECPERSVCRGSGVAHGRGHVHSHSKVELPDYKQWKIEGTPLDTVQEKLGPRGLRDLWDHSEVWRYKVTLETMLSLLVHY